MTNTFRTYEEAVLMNDESHRKSIRDVDGKGIEGFGERQDAFAQISAEAKMWLNYLFWVHDVNGKDS